MDMCRFFYGCDRVYVYDGINNMKSIFSIYSLPFYKVHERLTETMKHVSGVKTSDTRTFSLFFFTLSCLFLCQTVCDILLLYICLPTGFFFYALLSNRYFFYLSFMKFFKSLYVIAEILDHQIYNSITEC